MTILETHLSTHISRRSCSGRHQPPQAGQRTLTECQAMIRALACGDKGFTRAGVTFEQTDHQVTLVKHGGHTVAELQGRFGTETVVALIRRNLAVHARTVVADLNRALTGLSLPVGHTYRLDEGHNVNAILSRGASQLHGYIGGRAAVGQVQISGEFQFSLAECRAHLKLTAGDRFSDGESLLKPGVGQFNGETYAELADQMVSCVNECLHKHMKVAI
ncbi:hypothetical protein GFL03_21865 [Pseudomonas stutzeri]|uniref:hypothetical protein n=1 Tax=Stutzerimonas frequens TaxID=2968969 RepID=UPI00190DCA37|nr:hypothetical protein [Stutzerimonas frequens]MBK3919922.1 hypothetical protein [Stutzerimonas frequens]